MERQENMGKDGLLHCSVCGEPTQKILPFPLMDGSEGTRDMKVHIMCSCEKKERDAYDREQKQSLIILIHLFKVHDVIPNYFEESCVIVCLCERLQSRL